LTEEEEITEDAYWELPTEDTDKSCVIGTHFLLSHGILF
jgi:hypothetical protein